MGLYIKLCTI